MFRRDILKGLAALGLMPNLGSANGKKLEPADSKENKFVLINSTKYKLTGWTLERRMLGARYVYDAKPLEIPVSTYLLDLEIEGLFLPEIGKEYDIEFDTGGKIEACGRLVQCTNQVSKYQSILKFTDVKGKMMI